MQALTAPTDVVVDLSGLAFADLSLMADLAMLSRRLRRHGRRLRLRGARPQIIGVIETWGLDRLPGVLLERPSRLAV